VAPFRRRYGQRLQEADVGPDAAEHRPGQPGRVAEPPDSVQGFRDVSRVAGCELAGVGRVVQPGSPRPRARGLVLLPQPVVGLAQDAPGGGLEVGGRLERIEKVADDHVRAALVQLRTRSGQPRRQ
jgi:hypothetical protein